MSEKPNMTAQEIEERRLEIARQIAGLQTQLDAGNLRRFKIESQLANQNYTDLQGRRLNGMAFNTQRQTLKKTLMSIHEENRRTKARLRELHLEDQQLRHDQSKSGSDEVVSSDVVEDLVCQIRDVDLKASARMRAAERLCDILFKPPPGRHDRTPAS